MTQNHPNRLKMLPVSPIVTRGGIFGSIFFETAFVSEDLPITPKIPVKSKRSPAIKIFEIGII